MTPTKISMDTREKVGLALIAVASFLLVLGLVKLQIIQYGEMTRQSESNRLRMEPIIPRRGLVLDRFGERIIDNRPSYTLCVVPVEEVPGVTVPHLAALLGLDTAQVRKRIQKNTISRYQPAPVKRDVPFKAIAILEEQNARFPGVTYQTEQVRQYPVGLGTESFTGYVGEVSRDELDQSGASQLKLGRMVGKKGIEKQYDLELRGIEGTRYVEVSASGQVIGDYADKPRVPAIPGADLTLSIDLNLQRACGKALDTFCCGAIVAADPKTGGILAMASFPGYDANIFSSVIPESLWSEILGDSTHPLLNRPIAGQYPPGSTVKFVTVGAALQEGIITPSTTLKPCVGGFQFGDRWFRCWDPAGHGALTAAHAIEQSCDVFMYQLGLKLGVDMLSSYFDRCGFGHPTGIDLPGEAPGLNPNSDWYNANYHQWTRALVMNNAIGQGEVLVTPLHLLQFYCGLANHGVVDRLHLVRKISYPDGHVQTFSPQVAFTLPFDEATMATLYKGLTLVVWGDHGTARSLRRKDYRIGGKTGTAQNPHGANHSWFVGVAPLDNPEIVVCAIVENAGHGSTVAAPIVGKIIDAYMALRHPKIPFASADTSSTEEP